MVKLDFQRMSISELRSLAKKHGISQRSVWKKSDFIKALLNLTGQRAEEKHLTIGAQKSSRATAKSSARAAAPQPPAKRPAAKAVKAAVAKAPAEAAKKSSRATAKSSARAAAPQPPVKRPAAKAVKAAVAKAPAEAAKKSSRATAKSSARAAAPQPPAKRPAAKAVKSPAGTSSVRMRKAAVSLPTGDRLESRGGKPKVGLVARRRQRRPEVHSKVTLMVVDPYRLFVYWDIRASDVDAIVRDGEGFSAILRIHFYGEDQQTGFFDVLVNEFSGRKYLDIIPDRGYRIEFGISKGAHFYSLASSVVKYTPAFRIEKGHLSAEESEIFLPQIPHPRNRLSS